MNRGDAAKHVECCLRHGALPFAAPRRRGSTLLSSRRTAASPRFVRFRAKSLPARGPPPYHFLMAEPTSLSSAIHLETSGDAGGVPLVLVHGFPLDGRIFDAQRRALADRWRVIVPDLPGFGRSGPLPAGASFTIASLADDLHAALSAAGALPCVLGGLSMGGYVALAFARRHPEGLRGLALIDTRAEADTPEGRSGRESMIQAVRERGAKAAAEQMLPKMIAQSTAKSRPEIARAVREIMESQPAETIACALAALRDREAATPWLPQIAAPTLVMVGEHDAITPPALSEKMKAALPTSWLTVIPGSGHLSSMERPDEVTARLAGFMGQLRQAA